MTDRVHLSRDELDDIAEHAATRALARVGLHDEDAGKDVTELRGLLDAWRTAKTSAISAVAKGFVMLILAAIAAYVGVKSHFFGGG